MAQYDESDYAPAPLTRDWLKPVVWGLLLAGTWAVLVAAIVGLWWLIGRALGW